MIRLAIAVLHTALAALTTTGALFTLAQGRAGLAWDLGFVGQVGDDTLALCTVAVLSLAFGVTHGLAAVSWFAGSQRGGWTLLAASVVTAAGAPWSLVFFLSITSLLVSLDLMVEAHRAQRARLAPPSR